MKKLCIALGLGLALTCGSAFAFHCPIDMKAIDEALAQKPKLSEAQLTEIKQYREQGAELHKAGKHAESVEVLGKAKAILGLK